MLLFEIIAGKHPYISEDIEELDIIEEHQYMYRKVTECQNLMFPVGMSAEGLFLFLLAIEAKRNSVTCCFST